MVIKTDARPNLNASCQSLTSSEFAHARFSLDPDSKPAMLGARGRWKPVYGVNREVCQDALTLYVP